MTNEEIEEFMKIRLEEGLPDRIQENNHEPRP